MDLFYPLKLFADWLTYSLFNLSKENIVGSSLNFFIYDVIKIFILLCIIIFFFAFIRTYLHPEKIKKILSGKFKITGNFIASFIGIFTPFCSCSAVPLFIGFVESGVPLGVTFSYLIAAPMINEVAAVLLLGLFGWKIALLYVASGFIIAVVAGFILGKLKINHLVENYVWNLKNKQVKVKNMIFKERINKSYAETSSLVKKVFPYILIGVGIGSLIHGYAPENLLTTIASKRNLFAVPIAVLIGIPLYSNAAGIIPIVSSLIEKGLPLGTSLAFMMAVTALSIPEAIILRKVLKPKLLAVYFAIVTLGIIFTGYLFNLIL
ncbi:MAG: permease [Candidatus Nanoarchaeia archaeon]|nr:permease [Candidatus Nanoarchaeia archaeon]